MKALSLPQASQDLRAAVRALCRVEMVDTGTKLPIPVQGEPQITDERIGEPPWCYHRLTTPGDPRWIWGPDPLKGNSQIPVYRLQGARS